MKTKIIIMAALLSAVYTFAQSPEAFQYQAVLRNADGILMNDQTVTIQIDLIQTEIEGTVVYSETHIRETNAKGLVTLEIGRGTTDDDFSSIKWGEDSHFIKVWLNGSEMGTMQLLSVPYAIYSETADHSRTFDILLSKGDTPCNETNEGAMRYNTTTNLVEFCNGSNWIALSGGLSVQLAQLITKPATGITINSAHSGGDIINNGGAEIFEKGVCWNLSGSPGLSDNLSNNGSGSENYTSTIYGLNSNQIYYIRAYAKNTVGTAFGDEKSFTTLVNVTHTKNAEYINRSTFRSGGILDPGGNGTISEKGIVFGTTTNPTKQDNYVVYQNTGNDFVVSFNNLEDESYFYRAYAINETGINFGPEYTYRNHYVTENTINIIPSSVEFSKVYGDSHSPPNASSPDNGKSNTQTLVSYFGGNAVAAYICDTLTVNGYTDWFLPSKEELNHIYLNRDVLGLNDYDAYCWSSTVNIIGLEQNSWVQNISSGQQESHDFLQLNNVICIRRKD